MSIEAGLPSILLDNVSVNFGGLRALKDVSFEISSGEVVGLIGPNGAGKTTVFNVISGFVKPTSGTVHFPAAKRKNVKPCQLARAGVARTLQGVGLFPHLTVLENVMAGAQTRPHGGFFTSLFALPAGIHEERRLRADASIALERMGIGAFAGRYPGAIPYGIAKKVAFARALMCRPSVLLLDEPASGLDEAELEEFSGIIREMREGIALLLVEHDMNFVMPLVDRLIVLDFGEVIASGSPSEVRANPAVIEAYLGVEQ